MSSRFRIQLATPFHNSEIEDAVLSVIRSGWWVAGKHVGEFEKQLALKTERKHAISVSSGTGALLCAMVAMGIGPHSTVVIPAFTFPAPADVAAFLGAKIRLCDVDERTFNISEDTLLDVLDDEVSLVVGIDQFGSPCPASALENICRKRGIPFLVDAACSLGATELNGPCGAFGQVAIVSFHPRKIITTGEGGVVLTNDDNIASSIRRFRNIGLENGKFESVGLNMRPSESGAAMGEVQLAMLDEIISYRRSLAKAYATLPFQLQHPLEGATVNYQSLVAVLPPFKKNGDCFLDSDRNDLITFLGAKGIEAQVGSYHLPQIDWLASRADICDAHLPNSARLGRHAVTLPLHWRLTIADVQEVVECCMHWMHQIGE